VKNRRVLVIAGNDQSLVNFRGPLLGAMVAAGHEVLAAAPPESPDLPDRLAAIGVRFVPVYSLQRAGTNPWAEWKTRRELTAVMRAECPDTVLAYTIKPIVHGLPAAAAAGVSHRFALVTGLGTAFHSDGWRGALLRGVASRLYRSALSKAEAVYFQNDESRTVFLNHGIILPATRAILVAGSGVDTAHYTHAPLETSQPTFLMLARLLRDKGVAEYVAAARICRAALPSARFLLVGSRDPNPTAVPSHLLETWQAEGIVEFRDAVSDVRPLLAGCSVYVLPSYHEGMPRSVIEAMATGRPVITTDAIGCRETIIGADRPDADGLRWGENGVLVPVKDSVALAAAMLRLVSNPEMLMAMGKRARIIAEQQFDVRRINDVILRTMDLLPHEGLPKQVPCRSPSACT